MQINPENVYFVLVEPRTPGNVGAACRALKTMGFRNLSIVKPCDYRDTEARWMAHASEDILEGIKEFSSLQDSIAGINFVVAATQRIRGYHFPYFTPQEISKKMISVSHEHKTAIIFGRERTGLTNEEISCCHAITTIPAAVSHPSLNLSQAVMLYAYELFVASYDDDKNYHWNFARHEEIEGVYQHLKNSLQQVEFKPKDNWDNFIMRFRRMFGRANPEVRDVKLMHKILQSFDEYLHPKK